MKNAHVIAFASIGCMLVACGSSDSPAPGGKAPDAGGATYGASACGGSRSSSPRFRRSQFLDTF